MSEQPAQTTCPASVSSAPPSPTAAADKDGKPAIYQWASSDGEFRRKPSIFRNWISKDQNAKFTPEKGRYHLYVSLACPWAHRTLILRALKGLEDTISVSIVNYFMGPDGWSFEPCPGFIPDTVNNVYLVKELYLIADKDYNGRYTVPILWDKKTNTIVNNESSEIIRMFNSAFDEFSSSPGVTFYPDAFRHEIDAVNEWIYSDINNGVYKAGFATNQDIYNKAVVQVFKSLDRVEEILSRQAFLVKNYFTEADIRLFTTIYRFDPVYHGHFKCNLKSITNDYPNILRWARQIYHISPKIAETCNMEHVKKHYYMSHLNINPNRIVPAYNGPDLSVFVDPNFVPKPKDANGTQSPQEKPKSP